MRPTTLVILAAGLGTRYGGLKQLETVGPAGELILDYAIYDALEAGMRRVVFVVQSAMEKEFREHIGRRIESRVECVYVHQERNDCLPDGIVTVDRSLPWGTGHALLVASEVIDGPFVVINADDYYGRRSFRVLMDSFAAQSRESRSQVSMVGYRLERTLSPHGSVSRGICRCTDGGELIDIIERVDLRAGQGGVTYTDERGDRGRLSGREIVSMNLWCMTPDLMGHIEAAFHRFVQEHETDGDAEFYLPALMNRLVQEKQVRVRVLQTPDEWFGVTYAQDRENARRRIATLTEQGHYPMPLWGRP